MPEPLLQQPQQPGAGQPRGHQGMDRRAARGFSCGGAPLRRRKSGLMLQHGGLGREPSPSQGGQDGWSPPNPSVRVQRGRPGGRKGWGWPVVLYGYRRRPGHAQTSPGAPQPTTTTNSGSASVLTARRSEAERSWRGGATRPLARQVGAGDRVAQGGGPTGAAWVDTGDPAGQKVLRAGAPPV